MPAFDGSTFAANVQVMLAHRAFAEGQVECRSQTPAPVRPETPREILGMVVTVVEKHIEDGSWVGFLYASGDVTLNRAWIPPLYLTWD